MEIGDQERDIISFHSFPPQNEEILCPLGQEPGKFMDQDMLDLVRLFDLDTHADRVYTWLYQYTFVLVPRYGERI